MAHPSLTINYDLHSTMAPIRTQPPRRAKSAALLETHHQLQDESDSFDKLGGSIYSPIKVYSPTRRRNTDRRPVHLQLHDAHSILSPSSRANVPITAVGKGEGRARSEPSIADYQDHKALDVEDDQVDVGRDAIPFRSQQAILALQTPSPSDVPTPQMPIVTGLDLPDLFAAVSPTDDYTSSSSEPFHYVPMFVDPPAHKDANEGAASNDSFHYMPSSQGSGSSEPFHYVPSSQRPDPTPCQAPLKEGRSHVGSGSDETFHYPGARSSPKTPCPAPRKRSLSREERACGSFELIQPLPELSEEELQAELAKIPAFNYMKQVFRKDIPFIHNLTPTEMFTAMSNVYLRYSTAGVSTVASESTTTVATDDDIDGDRPRDTSMLSQVHPTLQRLRTYLENSAVQQIFPLLQSHFSQHKQGYLNWATAAWVSVLGVYLKSSLQERIDATPGSGSAPTRTYSPIFADLVAGSYPSFDPRLLLNCLQST